MSEVQMVLGAWEEETYQVIAGLIEEKGYPPSRRELLGPLGLASLGALNWRLRKLRGLGWVTWIPGQARTLRVVRRSDGEEETG